MNGNRQKSGHAVLGYFASRTPGATAQASANDLYSPVGYHAWHVRDVAPRVRRDPALVGRRRNSSMISRARARAHASEVHFDDFLSQLPAGPALSSSVMIGADTDALIVVVAVLFAAFVG